MLAEGKKGPRPRTPFETAPAGKQIEFIRTDVRRTLPTMIDSNEGMAALFSGSLVKHPPPSQLSGVIRFADGDQRRLPGSHHRSNSRCDSVVICPSNPDQQSARFWPGVPNPATQLRSPKKKFTRLPPRWGLRKSLKGPSDKNACPAGPRADRHGRHQTVMLTSRSMVIDPADKSACAAIRRAALGMKV